MVDESRLETDIHQDRHEIRTFHPIDPFDYICARRQLKYPTEVSGDLLPTRKGSRESAPARHMVCSGRRYFDGRGHCALVGDREQEPPDSVESLRVARIVRIPRSHSATSTSATERTSRSTSAMNPSCITIAYLQTPDVPYRSGTAPILQTSLSACGSTWSHASQFQRFAASRSTLSRLLHCRTDRVRANDRIRSTIERRGDPTRGGGISVQVAGDQGRLRGGGLKGSPGRPLVGVSAVVATILLPIVGAFRMDAWDATKVR